MLAYHTRLCSYFVAQKHDFSYFKPVFNRVLLCKKDCHLAHA
jgi:hypothetical protein